MLFVPSQDINELKPTPDVPTVAFGVTVLLLLCETQLAVYTQQTYLWSIWLFTSIVIPKIFEGGLEYAGLSRISLLTTVVVVGGGDHTLSRNWLKYCISLFVNVLETIFNFNDPFCY